MQLGVFIPIGNNGWLISTTSPQYMPSFELNRTVVEKAERFGFDFALSMIKLRGFGGPSEFWDHNLESFTLMAGLAAVTTRIQLFATIGVLTMPPPIVARMAVTIDSISHGRFGVNVISGWQETEYSQMGIWPGAEHYRRRYEYCEEYVTVMRELWATGRSDFKGEFFTMDGLPLQPFALAPIPIVCAGQSDRGTRFAAEYADYNFVASSGLNDPTRIADPVARLVDATAQTGRSCGALVLTMIIADETDEAATAKWEHYKAGTDFEALAWRDGQAGNDTAARRAIHRRPLRQDHGAEAAHQPERAGRLLRARRRHAGRPGRRAGRAGRDADLRRFRRRHGAVRHPHPAADAEPPQPPDAA